MQEIEVFAFKHQSVVDSRDVADATGRPHKQLMRTVQKMITHLNASINERKFAPVDFFIPATYLDEKGEQCPRFYCNLCDTLS